MPLSRALRLCRYGVKGVYAGLFWLLPVLQVKVLKLLFHAFPMAYSFGGLRWVEKTFGLCLAVLSLTLRSECSENSGGKADSRGKSGWLMRVCV